MITNLITLKLISVNLHKFQNIQEGTISSIRIGEKANDSDVIVTLTYNSLQDLDAKISAFPEEPDWTNIQCTTLSLFKLDGFNITTTNGSNKNKVQFDGLKFTAKSQNIQEGAMSVLNSGKNSYISRYNGIFASWKKLEINEYIKMQRQYIDCGYIQVYFEDAINYLKSLHKDYTQNKNK